MKFFQRLFGIKDQSELIEAKFNAMQEKIVVEVASLRNENISLKTEINNKSNRIVELLTKVRDQNESDLFLEAKKIEKRILDGEQKSQIDTERFYNYQSLQNVYNQQLMATRNIGNSGMLGGFFR